MTRLFLVLTLTSFLSLTSAEAADSPKKSIPVSPEPAPTQDAPPVISADGTLNGASFLGGAIAPGEIVSLFGTGLGPAEGVLAEIDDEGKVATERAGVQVLFGDVAGPLYFVRRDQINVQVPYEVFGETAVDVRVVVDGQSSNTVGLPVALAAPGLFKIDAQDSPIIAVLPGGSMASPGSPASLGDVIVIYATGEGQTVPAGVTGGLAAEPFPIPVLPVEVLIGGAPAELLYAGAAPGFAGLMQVNVIIPETVSAAIQAEGVEQSNQIPIELIIGELRSQPGATVALDLPGVNNPPMAEPDAATTERDTPVSIPVLVNDSDVDADPLTITSVTDPANGTTSVMDNAVLYTPSAGYVGQDNFTYTISDNRGGTDTASVAVTVTPPDDGENSDPVAVGASVNVEAGASTRVYLSAGDQDGDVLTFSILTPPARGTLGPIEPSSPGEAQVVYNAPSGYEGADNFTFGVDDGQGGTAQGAVSIRVFIQTPERETSAVTDSVSTPEDTPINIDVLSNDIAAPGAGPLSLTAVFQPTNGIAEIFGALIRYTPNPDYSGADSFTYTMEDTEGASRAATVNVNVTPVNDPPVAQNDAAATVEDTPVNVDVLVNDSDPENDALAVGSVTQGASGSVTNNGSDVTYTPNTGFLGSDSFSYTVVDGNGGSDDALVSVQVNAAADVSVTKSAQGAFSAGGQGVYQISVANSGPSTAENVQLVDTFPAGLTYSSSTNGGCSAGGATVTCNLGSIASGDSVDFTITFDIPASARGNLTNSAAVTTTTNDTNNGNNTTSIQTTVSVTGDLSITKTGAPNPIMDGDDLTYTITVSNAGPADATGATVNDTFPSELTGVTWTCVGAGGGSCTASGSGAIADTVNIPAGGSVTYTATGTVDTGTDTTLPNTATVSAPSGFTDSTPANNSATDNVTVSVNAVPVANAGADQTGVVGETLSFNGSASSDPDTQPNPTLTYSWQITSAPAGSTAVLTNAATATPSLTPDIAGGYTVELTVNDGAADATDTAGATVSQAATTTTITADAADPSALNQAYTVSGTVAADAPSAATVSEGTVDVSDGAGGTCNASVSAGAFSCSVTSTVAGAKTLTATYNGTANFAGSSDTEAHDVSLGAVTVTITPTSPDPSALGSPVSFAVTVAPVAPATDTPTGTVTIANTATESCMITLASGSGSCNITPASAGADTYTATYSGDSNYATNNTSTEMHSVNSPPVAQNHSFDTVGGVQLQVLAALGSTNGSVRAVGTVLTGATDDGVGTVTAVAGPITGADGGTGTMNADGTFSFTPSSTAGASETFTYQLTDGIANSNTATVTVNITGGVIFVDSSANSAGAGTGSSSDPFGSLSDGTFGNASNDAEDAVAANGTIIVRVGASESTPYNQPFAFKNGVRLLGEPAGLTTGAVCCNGNTNQELIAPNPAGTQPVISGALTVDSNARQADLLNVEIVELNLTASQPIAVSCSGATPYALGVSVSDSTLNPGGGGNGILFQTAATGCGSSVLSFDRNTVQNIPASSFGVNVDGNASNPVTVDSFSGNTLQTGISGGGVSFANTVFDADSSDADFTGDTVVVDALTIGGGSPVGESGLVLTGVAGDLSITTLSINATVGGLLGEAAGALNAVAGTGFGLTLGDASAITAAVPIDLDPMTVALGTSGDGITITGDTARFDALSGAAYFDATSSLTGAVTTPVLSIANGTLLFDYDGTITADGTDSGISFASNTGGSATLNGAVDIGGTTPLTSTGVAITGNNASFAAAFSDLDIATNGATALMGTASGSLDVDAGVISATSASAIDVAGLDFGTSSLGLTSVTVNGGARGIRLSNTTGTVNITGGSIGSTTTAGVDLSGHGGAFTYGGSITNSAGKSVDVDSLGSGFMADFTGAINDGGTGIDLTNNTGATVRFTGMVTLNTGDAGVPAFNATGGGTVTQNNAASTVTTNSAVALNFNGVTAALSLASVNVAAGTGGCMSFVSTPGQKDLGSISCSTSGSTGLFANSAGTINSTGGSISATSGIGVNVQSTALGMTLTSLGATGAAHGALFMGATGSFTAGAGGTISGTTTAGVEVDGGTANVTIGSNIANSSGRSAIIENLTGSPQISLTGTINDTGSGLLVQNNHAGVAAVVSLSGTAKTFNTGANNGVTLTNNDATTINFTNGGLDIDTTSGVGFSASAGAAGINVTGSNNTINSTSATALNWSSVTRGSSGVTFQSISAASAAKGISLDTVGGSGAFTVTGTSTTDGTGGTISNITQRGIEVLSTNNVTFQNMTLTNAGTTSSGANCNNAISSGSTSGCFAGVHLDTLTGATLTNVDIGGTSQAQNGISGWNVTNLAISNSTINESGDGTSDPAIRVFNLFGSSSISNTTVSDGHGDNVRIQNDSNTASTLTVTGSTFSGSKGGLGMHFSGRGNSQMTLDVQTSEFLNNFSSGIQPQGSDDITASGGSFDFTIKGNFFENNGAAAIDMGFVGNSPVTFDISNNGTLARPIINHGSHVINVNQGAAASGALTAATINGQIVNNVVGSNSSTGTTAGNAIRIVENQNGVMRILVDSNTLRGWFDYGIEVFARDAVQGAGSGNSDVDVTITNNTVNQPNSFPINAIRAQVGANVANEEHDMCVQIEGNTVDTNFGSTFAEGIRLRERDPTTAGTLSLFKSTSGSTDPADILEDLNTIQGGAGASWSGAGVTVTTTGCVAPTL